MASITGTSGSSGGQARQPPNKRIKVEIDLTPDSNNSSNENSVKEVTALYSNQPGNVSSATRVQTEHLKCSVCQEYPRKEVYQCDEGHIVCSGCIALITRCPVCPANYQIKRIRNRIAEAYLDQMTYNCSFRNYGCSMTNIPRHRRTAHDIQCSHNPSKPGFNFCSLLNGTEACQFRVDPDSIMQYGQHRKDVIDHLTGLPHNLLFQTVKIGEKISLQFLLPASSSPPFEPLVLFEVYDTTGNMVGNYVLIRRVSMRKNLSMTVLGFNSAAKDLNGGYPRKGRIPAIFAITPKPDQSKRTKDGDGCIQNQKWTIKSTYLNEWKDFMNMPVAHRPLSSFELPLTFLSDYYKKQDGRFEMIVMFGPLVN